MSRFWSRASPSISHLLASATLVLPIAPALACPHPAERVEYGIHHETYGDVGRHVITFSCRGDDVVVETRVEGEVKVLMVPLFKRSGSYREVWRGDRLIVFDARTEDNGEVYEVSARANGDHTVINGRRGRIEAPANIISNHPWNHEVVGRTLLFDTQRGQLQRVQVTPSGTEAITVAGRTVAAQKYLVTGDLERELWYDPAGNWLQSRFEHNGDEITLTRQSVRVRAGFEGPCGAARHSVRDSRLTAICLDTTEQQLSQAGSAAPFVERPWLPD